MPARKRSNLSRDTSHAKRLQRTRCHRPDSDGSQATSSQVPSSSQRDQLTPQVFPCLLESLHERPSTSVQAPSTTPTNQLPFAAANDQITPISSELPDGLQGTRQPLRAPTVLTESAFNYIPNCDYSAHSAVRIGKMETSCGFCRARKFRTEPPGLCCANGKVKLPVLLPPPEPLASLVVGETPEAKHFLKNIRKYNSCFQMTSFGATRIIRDTYMPTFKIQGQVYHRIGSLLPSPGSEPTFLQIYFMGNSEEQAGQRRRFNTGTRQPIVLALQEFFHEHNQLIRSFRTALDNEMHSDDYVVVIRPDKAPSGHHVGRYNAPTTNDVAVLMVGDQFHQRDIVIHRRHGNLDRIPDTNRAYDALQYPILFWQGEDGYHFNLRMRNPATNEETTQKVSSMNFYAYRLMTRDSADNHILRCGQVFHQYAVDMYVKIESERLLFLRLNQTTLRAENYDHLRDAIASDANVNLQDLGRRVILPATFTGSPRHMHEYAQDALTYVRAYGRPDLFLTFTCNPAWEEITELLLPGQKSSDRPDIGTRVFKQKLKALLNFIVKQRVFGTVRCWMYSVEWQKRGLPHSHMLIWLTDKVRPDRIDDVISAEIPDERVDKPLFDIVTRHMIHGPCGSLNPSSPCMKEGRCTKRFPKQFTPHTVTGGDGYPLYRRRTIEDGGRCFNLRCRYNVVSGDPTHAPTYAYSDREIDNRWVVPYSPLLSRTFKAHVNVEYCHSVKVIKYICKYIFKGNDMATFGVSNTNDEIELYQTGRYITTYEALWRIFSFALHERYPTVVHLAVHLENGQRVYFTEQNLHVIVAPQTTLTAFFSLCSQDAFARSLLYSEIPTYYVWMKNTKKFERRKQGRPVEGHHDVYASDALGRVYTVHPNNHECFFLRLLLFNTRGPRSFQDLRTVNGELCGTYREACQRLNLLEHDAHWEDTLADAASTARPHLIRTLFAIILCTCAPSNPSDLWNKFKDSMSDDVLHHSRLATDNLELPFSSQIYNEALIRLEDQCLTIANKLLSALGLFSPDRAGWNVLDGHISNVTQFDVNVLSQFVEENLSKLLPEQRAVYDSILDAVDNNLGRVYFLDAPGGTGKTFLLSIILATIRSRNSIALALASSGIAATLLEGGRTAHSALKLPLDLHNREMPVCGISKNSGMGRILQTCKLIVWDEATMAHKKALEALDRTLQDFRDQRRPFGGALLLLSGDFRQTLPVIPRSTPADELGACLKSSVLWRQVVKVTLKTNMRVLLQNDAAAEDFIKQLLAIGNGEVFTEASSQTITLPGNFCNIVLTEEDLIRSIFPDLANNFRRPSWLSGRAILAPRNNAVHAINNTILESVPGEVRSYNSIDTVVEPDQAVNFPTEFLNSLDLSGMPPHTLSLKIGVPIILLRNINPPRLCNGTRLAVKCLRENIIEATILTGTYKGEDVLLPRIPLRPSDSPVEFTRLQFPVRVAFAMTINKAQGQSLQQCGLQLENPCFSHGQLYVACSRVGKPSALFVLAQGRTTKNIVYPQALQ